MNKSEKTCLTLFLLWFIILSHQILSVICEEQYNEEKPPPLFQFVSSTISLLKKSHQSSWEKMKTTIRDFQLQFFPPNLDFRGTAKSEGSESIGENMKVAAKKSMGTSKATVEETAKSAADIAGEAVHKTAEKVKEAVSDKEQSQDEL